VPPGRGFKAMLDKTLYAKIDGKFKTKKEELDFLRRQLGEN
jgi:hypothetical protein